MRETGHEAPEGWQGDAYPEDRGKLPVGNVAWNDAIAFCKAACDSPTCSHASAIPGSNACTRPRSPAFISRTEPTTGLPTLLRFRRAGAFRLDS